MDAPSGRPVIPVAAELMLIAQLMRGCVDAPEAVPVATIADSLTVLSAATRLMEIELGLVRGVMTAEDAAVETTALLRAAEPQNQQIAGVA